LQTLFQDYIQDQKAKRNGCSTPTLVEQS